jgi:two-component system response regulator YesN
MATGTPIQDSSNELHPEYNRVELVKTYVTGHLDSDLSASTVAGEFNFSLSTLHHLFKKYEGQTYQRYVEEMRMNRAIDLITKEGFRVNEAMYATGYRHRATFNAAFKRKFNHPPRHFRK